MPKTLHLPGYPPSTVPSVKPVDLKQHYSPPTGNAKMPMAKIRMGANGAPTIKGSYNFDDPSTRKGKHAGK